MFRYKMPQQPKQNNRERDDNGADGEVFVRDIRDVYTL